MAELDLRGGSNRRKAIDASELRKMAIIRRRTAMQTGFITGVAFILLIAIFAMMGCTVPLTVEKPRWFFERQAEVPLPPMPLEGSMEYRKDNPCSPSSITPN
jgi:Ca2+/Na+ antiporter